MSLLRVWTPYQTPEDIAALVTGRLLEEIQTGGVIDSFHQSLLLLFMALGPEDVSTARVGPLTPQAVRTLRLIKRFLGVEFKIRMEKGVKGVKWNDEEEGEEEERGDRNTEGKANRGTVLLSCLGCGMRNTAKSVT